MKSIVAAISMAVTACFGPIKEQPEAPIIQRWPVVLVFDSGVSSTLNFLAQGLHNELAVCGIGTIRNDTAIVTALVIPEIHSSDENAVVSGECPLNTVTRWHNHPFLDLPQGSVTPRDMCYLSDGDMRSIIRSRTPFATVSTGLTIRCYWTIEQAREGLRKGYPLLMPVRGQTTYELTNETLDDRLKKINAAFGVTSRHP